MYAEKCGFDFHSVVMLFDFLVFVDELVNKLGRRVLRCDFRI
jgi:hypothetical protein